jgi:2-oxoglutarate ferredoxin oxidoreductase subunit alpha
MEHVFNLAERYQCPVFLLIDQMLAQSSYTCPPLDPSRFNIDRGKLLTMEEAVKRYNGNGNTYKRYELTEDGVSPRVYPGTPGINTYYTNTNEHTEDGYITEEETVRKVMVEKRVLQRMPMIKNDPDLPQPRYFGDESAKIGFISAGSTFGPILEAIDRLKAQGTAAKFMELRTIWPLHAKAVQDFIASCDKVYTVEYSATDQLRGIIQREATGPSDKLHSIMRYDGRFMTPGFILQEMEAS